MKNIIVVYLCYFAVIGGAIAFNSKSSMQGKIIHKVENYSDPLRPEYETIVKYKEFLYSISELPESGGPIHFCTGVGLSSNSILTAAHCMQKYEKTNNYTKLRVSNENTNREVLTSDSHADYESGFSDFTDICIVTLKQLFFESVITLPTRDCVIEPQKNALLLGWTSPDHRKRTFMNVNLLSEDGCTRFLNENNVMVPRQFKSYLLCVIPSTGKLDVDKADIGSPLFLNNVVVGILSGKSLNYFKGVHILINVSKHMKMIKEEMSYSVKTTFRFLRGQPLLPRRKRSEKKYPKNLY